MSKAQKEQQRVDGLDSIVKPQRQVEVLSVSVD